MKKFAETLLRWYTRLVLDHPLIVILALGLVISFLGYKAKDFRIDASAETLLLENDPDLRYSREIVERYGVNDFLLIAYTPKSGDLMSDATLADIGRLRDDLKALPRVTSVLTLLDVPLFESPPLSYAEVSEGIRTLASPDTDKALARSELRDSPFYRDLIISEDLRTTAIMVNMEIDTEYQALISERNDYMDKKAEGRLSDADEAALEAVQQKIRTRLDLLNALQHQNIEAVRTIMDNYRPQAELFLGGVSMIQDDMISFVRNDLLMFGLGVFALLVLMLGIIFRRLLWIVLPMLCCFLSVLSMMGILALFEWEVTVISSNFVSLQLIITLSLVIHLIVRYREYRRTDISHDQRALVHDTISSMFRPCLYAVLTTIAGFSSLVFCDIKPVIHFGWMMSAGIVLSLILTFILFPATVMLAQKRALKVQKERQKGIPLSEFLGRFTQRHGTLILVTAGLISILTVMGITRLRVENSFIDYFKESTEIYQGMQLIDQKLGGTTPLDVIVQFDRIDLKQFAEPDEELDPLLNPYAAAGDENFEKYWFFDERLEKIEQVHDYLTNLPETGKVLSLATLLKIGRTLNDDKPLTSMEMAVLYTKLPEEYKDLILAPYVSIAEDEVRFALRIKDSLPTLQRDELLKRIENDLTNRLNLAPDRVHLAGTMVLYNNMLQSLFSSQIQTMGITALALIVMFMILFRSLRIALIALFPNLLAAGTVLAIMGWLNIPLDMMTITIAAISLGIAVDDTIHYIYRFREEIKKDGDYYLALQHCHASIGHAMYYTSVTVIIGFSILSLSNFWPTIYFGLLTSLAMFIALAGALTLLPKLIVMFKPFGRFGKEGHVE
jgi:predicted RND superfamily exporter protein